MDVLPLSTRHCEAGIAASLGCAASLWVSSRASAEPVILEFSLGSVNWSAVVQYVPAAAIIKASASGCAAFRPWPVTKGKGLTVGGSPGRARQHRSGQGRPEPDAVLLAPI